MRKADVFKLSFRMVRESLVVWIGLLFAFATFCLYNAFSIYIEVQVGKAQPYELNITAQDTGKMTEGSLADILKIDNVQKVTPIIEVPVKIETGKYSFQLTLTGILPDYLQESLSQGVIFSANNVMTEIILNSAACDMLLNQIKEKDMDWLHTAIMLQPTGSSKLSNGKICGLLPVEKGNLPLAYISLSAAKELIKADQILSAKVRVMNFATVKNVTLTLEDNGYQIQNSTDILQLTFESKQKSILYLAAIGVLGLISGVFMIRTARRISKAENKSQWEMLHWIGMRDADVRLFCTLQTFILLLAGIAMGMIIAVSLQ